MTLPDTAFKKNGSLHLRNCAAFYHVQPHTVRVWQRAGAPIFSPKEMPEWIEKRNQARLQKIGQRNNRHGSKHSEIVRLYTKERLGLRAIARYFAGRPSTAGVRKILITTGVYRSGEAINEQSARSEARRKALIDTEKERRHRVALCLWQLRKGKPVETTCRENGWNIKSVWNAVRTCVSYHRFKQRKSARWPDKRRYGENYSRIYVREALLHERVRQLLVLGKIEFVQECRLQECRTRVDFKTADGTCIECKVGVNSGQVYEFIGQACHYRLFAKRVVLCVPSDVRIRGDLYALIGSLGIIVCNENTLLAFLGGEDIQEISPPIIPAKATNFVCKCCGSAEKRRHRTNSYCVDCAPSISKMKFDYRLNRWVIPDAAHAA